MQISKIMLIFAPWSNNERIYKYEETICEAHDGKCREQWTIIFCKKICSHCGNSRWCVLYEGDYKRFVSGLHTAFLCKWGWPMPVNVADHVKLSDIIMNK